MSDYGVGAGILEIPDEVQIDFQALQLFDNLLDPLLDRNVLLLKSAKLLMASNTLLLNLSTHPCERPNVLKRCAIKLKNADGLLQTLEPSTEGLALLLHHLNRHHNFLQILTLFTTYFERAFQLVLPFLLEVQL